MAGSSSWNAPVACVGLAAFVGMLFRFPVLLQMLENGEVALVKALPTVIGALLLLVASLGLLMRRPARGRIFAIATATLLIGLWWLPTLVFSVWLWLAVLAALAGAAIGFRGGRGTSAV
jgi:hypothetical protein